VGRRSREKILDQNLINEVYHGKIYELDREFNCVDTLGNQPGVADADDKACNVHCSKNVVVSHFTGHPKPTAAKRRLLELVRRPGSPALACKDTNFGSCEKWSEYYCDIRQYSKNLSKDLRFWLHKTGECCHSPFDPKLDKESCKECPASLHIKGEDVAHIDPQINGVYVKTNIKSSKYNGGKPIYINRDSMDLASPKYYLYYIQAQVIWLIGHNYTSNAALSYAGLEAQCPRDSGAWHFFNGTTWVMRRLAIKTAPNGHDAPADTEHIVWNLEARKWDREEANVGHLDEN